jgi:hypothetical protein
MDNKDLIKYLINEIATEPRCSPEHMYWASSIGPVDLFGYAYQGHELAMKHDDTYRRCYNIRSQLAKLQPDQGWMKGF